MKNIIIYEMDEYKCAQLAGLVNVMVHSLVNNSNTQQFFKTIRTCRRHVRFNFIYIQEFWTVIKDGRRKIHSNFSHIEFPDSLFAEKFYVLRVGNDVARKNQTSTNFDQMWVFGKNKNIDPEKFGFVNFGNVWELPIRFMKYKSAAGAKKNVGDDLSIL